jgi:hypothetical protein
MKQTLSISTKTRAPVTYHGCICDRFVFVFFTYLQSRIVFMLSGLHFPNPREFCDLNLCILHHIFSQVSFIQLLQFNRYSKSTINQIKHFFILYRSTATPATIRGMFEGLGFTPGDAASLEGNDHGTNTLEEVVFLNDKDIDSLVKQLRRPGGGD